MVSQLSLECRSHGALTLITGVGTEETDHLNVFQFWPVIHAYLTEVKSLTPEEVGLPSRASAGP